MNTLNPPKRVRQVLYVLLALGTPVVAYLNSRGILGADEVTLCSAVAAVVGGLAALNTTGRTEATVSVDAPADVDVSLSETVTDATETHTDERGATDVVTAFVVVFIVVVVLMLLGVVR